MSNSSLSIEHSARINKQLMSANRGKSTSTQRAGGTGSGAPSSTPTVANPALRLSRYLRNLQFNPITFIGYHPNTVYLSSFALFCVYWNYKFAEHNKGLYPDYDAIAADPTRAGTLKAAKEQEFAAVRPYNSLVDDMRADIRERTT